MLLQGQCAQCCKLKTSADAVITTKLSGTKAQGIATVTKKRDYTESEGNSSTTDEGMSSSAISEILENRVMKKVAVALNESNKRTEENTQKLLQELEKQCVESSKKISELTDTIMLLVVNLVCF